MFINHITRAFSSCVFYNLTMVSIIHPNASIIHVSQTDIDLILPAWSLFSIATFFVFGPIHILLKQRQASQGPSQWAESHSPETNAKFIMRFKTLRLLCSVGLLALSCYEIVSSGSQMTVVLIALVCSRLYIAILSSISLMARTLRWRTLSTRHVACLSVVAFFCHAWKFLRSYIIIDQFNGASSNDRILGWAKFGLLATSGVFIPLFMPRSFIALSPGSASNTEMTAPYISLLTYSFIDPLVWKAYHIPHLSLDELPPLQAEHSLASLTSQAFLHIDPAVIGSKDGPHIFRGLVTWLRRDYCFLLPFQTIQTLAQFIAPFSLKMLLQYLEADSDKKGGTRPWIWILLIALGPIITSVMQQRYLVYGTRILICVEAVLTQLVFEHTLRIRLNLPNEESTDDEAQSVIVAHGRASSKTRSSIVSTTVANCTKLHRGSMETLTNPVAGDKKARKSLIGTMTNLLTTDLAVLKAPGRFVLDLPFSIAHMILSVVFLWDILGWSALLSVLTMMLGVPILAFISRMLLSTQKKRMRSTDERVELVTQTLNIIRTVKLFAWEPKVKSQIDGRRAKELKLIRKGRLIEIAVYIVQSLLPVLTMICTYATYTILMKRNLSASVIFPSMAVFELFKENLQKTFFAIPMFLRAKVSLDRFNDFFRKTEFLDACNLSGIDRRECPPLDGDAEIKFNPSSHMWKKEGDHPGLSSPEHRFVLEIEKELTFQRGVINLILGPTASGKTSVLMALLGEMYSRSSGVNYPPYQLPRANGIAYAAQEPWIFNDTIKNNIVFGDAFDEDRYSAVLEQCALKLDISRFEAGDMTAVGEKGVTLSGGQKARITLARAVYSKAQTLLLDDVFSALDVHTAKCIVDKCFCGNLIRGRTVLLVTHNVALVTPVSSYAVVLSPMGKVVRQGSLSAILLESSTLRAEIQHDRAYIEEAGAKEEKIYDDEPKGKLIVAEEIALGRISWPAIRLYAKNYGNFSWISSLSACIVALGLNAFSLWFLGFWASQYESHDPTSIPVARFLRIYTSICCCAFIFGGLSKTCFVLGATKASCTIHDSLMQCILRAPLRWYDTVPLSRIISRCTTDIAAIDDDLPNWTESLLQKLIVLIIALAAVVYIAGWRAVLMGSVIAIAGVGCSRVYLKAQLCVKRENSNARSPVLSHFHTALSGAVSIRAYGVEDAFKSKSMKNIDQYTRSSNVLWDLNRWIAVRTDCLGALFSGLVGGYLVYGDHAIAASHVGFALNQVLIFSSSILALVRAYNFFEVQANSVERIVDLLVIDQEPLSTEQGKPPAHWPSSGNIKVDHLSAQYSNDGPRVLHDLSFEIKSGERVGIVGRTGAGKSTLALALLRAIPISGQVFYDDKDVAKLNLDALRSRITFIPQHPELLAGSVRDNLDPFSEYDEATLNDALRAAGLHSLPDSHFTYLDDVPITSDTKSSTSSHTKVALDFQVTLDTIVEAGGVNFSLGQRQIIALARAIVHQGKVLLFDEATASVDHDTDAIIQRMVRTELGPDTTVITIAHRLQTIMDYDRIMVLEAGRLVEFDSPAALLRIEGGMFKGMVDESTDRENLLRMADYRWGGRA